MRFNEYKLTEKSTYRDKLFKKHMASKLWGKLGESVSTDLEAEFPGLDLDLYDTQAGYILSKIVLPKEQRGFGIGTQVMQRLIDIADSEGKVIALTPDTTFGGSKGRLIDFYKRFGFVPNKGRNKDFRFRNTMIRNPRQDTNEEKISELDYKGAIGAMEVMKFYQVASPAQRQELKQLMSADKLAKAWKLIQTVTGMKLSDKAFNESPNRLERIP